MKFKKNKKSGFRFVTLKASKVTVPFSHFYDWKQEGKKNQKNNKTALILLGIRPEVRNLFLIYFKKGAWKCLTQNGQRHKGRDCLGYLLRGLILSGPFSSSLINTDTPGRLQVLALGSNETKAQLNRFKFTAQFQRVFLGALFGSFFGRFWYFCGFFGCFIRSFCPSQSPLNHGIVEAGKDL